MELLLRMLKFEMPFSLRQTGKVALIVAVVMLSACNTSKTFSDLTLSETLTHGYVVNRQAIDSVSVGSSREQVLLALGTPSTTATFDNNVFYYISQTRERSMAFAKFKLIEQRVLAIYFGANGRVSNIANYGIHEGKVFDFIARTTPTSGKDQNFLGQLLAGAGKTGSSAASSIFRGS